MEEINNKKSEIRLPVLMAIAIATGIFIGASFTSPKSNSEGIASNLAKFKEVLLSIDKNYVDSVNPDELTDQAIRRMLDGLDPHSNYIPGEDVERLTAQIQGSYEGIGIQFDILRDTVFVIKPLEGGPSIEAGLEIGDRIINVDEENIAGIGIKTEGVMDRLLGSSGSKVKVTVLRGNESLEYTIQRGKIPQKSVDSYYMIDEESGYLKIERFGAHTYEEFVSAVRDLKEKGMKKLIIDLQGNPGGLMSAAEKISDELLDGEKLIVEQKSIHSRYNSSTFAKKEGLFEQGPVIILVDEYSASASEIVAGAMQDNDRALIVGRRTFGKGLVQMPITLNDRSELRLTIARYYTPSGRSIQKPYDNAKSYHLDLNDRYEKGEFFHADSIKFQDSLKFETIHGRTVYAGGGIMPDYFVAYDTSMNTAYNGNLNNRRAIREFALKYYLKNKEKLNGYTLEEFQSSFQVSKAMLDDLVKIGTELEVVYNQEEFEKSLPLLKSQIRAELCSFIWDSNGYYYIINPSTNEIYIKALELFEEAQALAQVL